MNLQFTIHPQIVNLNRFSIQRIVNRDVPSSFLRLSFSGSRTTTIKLVTPTVQNKFLEDTRSPGLHQSSPTRPRGRFPLAAAYIHAQATKNAAKLNLLPVKNVFAVEIEPNPRESSCPITDYRVSVYRVTNYSLPSDLRRPQRPRGRFSTSREARIREARIRSSTVP